MTERRRLVHLAGVLVLVTASIHLALGVAGLYEAFVGAEPAGLAALYLLAGLAAFGLVGAYATGRLAPVRAYAVGAGLMALYLFAYADWHALGYAESVLPTETLGLEQHGHDGHSHNGHDHNGHDDGHDHNGHDHNGHDNGHSHEHEHDHDGSTTEVLIDHLRDDVYALVSKTAEAVAAVTLAVLALTER
jgi:hypothetical protein